MAAGGNHDGAQHNQRPTKEKGDERTPILPNLAENVQGPELLGSTMRYVAAAEPGRRLLRLTRAGKRLGQLVRQGRVGRDDAVTTVALVGLTLEVFGWDDAGQRAALTHAEAAVGGAT